MGMAQEGPQKEFNRETHQSQPTNTFLAFLHKKMFNDQSQPQKLRPGSNLSGHL